MEYVSYLENRVREYEQRCLEADVELQKKAQTLRAENAKLKHVLVEGAGITGEDLDVWNSQTVIETIKARRQNVSSQHSDWKLQNTEINSQTSGVLTPPGI